MAVSTFGNLAAAITRDVDLDATVEVLSSSITTLYGIEVDNTANTTAVYVKIWDIATAVTIGSTVPDFVIRVEAGSKLFQPFGSTSAGYATEAGLVIACVTTGGTSGTTGPTSSVKAVIATD